ncbi:hypothetical protein [Mucilaginibacter lacusdianchii]|uniref:hypothetical protein n=1 Tax=Mucilaginibacter lacusdianchii TaxID=2684211 RepID=UPI00131D864F|nr:hypothetical protein [Mucilaginibacter sp. JXJ CY 39]
MKNAVFSIALNGYAYRYSKCIDSHKKYANKNNCDYFLFTKPLWVNRPAVCSWLKVPLFLELFKKGYDNVFFLDADCLIGDDTPSLSTLIDNKGEVFLSQGHSGRINAGVIFSKNTPAMVNAFQQVINEFYTTIEKANQAPYENGHVIQYFTPLEQLTVLSRNWNSTTEVVGNAGITHYTGPNKKYYQFPPFTKMYSKIHKRITSVLFKGKMNELKSLAEKDYMMYCSKYISQHYL